jgi:hypothetical protein
LTSLISQKAGQLQIINDQNLAAYSDARRRQWPIAGAPVHLSRFIIEDAVRMAAMRSQPTHAGFAHGVHTMELPLSLC